MDDWSSAKLGDVANLVLGMILFFSPWLFGLSAGAQWQTASIIGIFIAVSSIAALAMGTGFEICQMSLPDRRKWPTISVSRASAPTRKPRLISATARLEFPLWPLPHAIKAAPAIRAIRRWSSNWTNAVR